MTYTPRWYQTESSQALFNAVKDDKECHPVAVLPTGSGKTFTICETINLCLSHNPLGNVLILSHVREILEQNHAALEGFFGIEIGLYSAGLKRKDIKQITVAGIQSCFRHPEVFSHFDLVIIDECHRIPIKSETMYRSFLDTLTANYIGLTATPYRLKHGYIYEGEGALFNKNVYDLSSMMNYNRLVEEGFLAPMYGKATGQKLDAEKEGIRTTAGDYNDKDLSIAFDRESITKAAIKEVMQFDERTVTGLVFAIDIKHAENIASELKSYDKAVAIVHSKMETDRDAVIKEIKALKYDYVVNVDVLTTGFDHPLINHIIDLAPTKSPVKHVQKLGRGARVHPDKDFCLVSDFAGNIESLGPINCVQVIQNKKKGVGSGEAIMKECPDCGMLNFAAVRNCMNCDHEFEFKEKIQATASSRDVIMKEVKQWVKVNRVTYSIHSKAGKTSSLKITYKCGLSTFSEWICYDHKGYAGHKARNWVKYRMNSKDKKPDDLSELFKVRETLMQPKKVYVDVTEKYPSILDYEF